ncbi:MAG: hypothetical protein ABIG87_00235 [Patescibacteria group bacterium]
MTPKNLPIEKNKYESDWWILEKASVYVDLEQNRFLDFFYHPTFKKWWRFSLSTTILLLIIVLSFLLVYQNTNIIYPLFPETKSSMAIIIQKTKIVPNYFIKIGADINERYNLASVFSAGKR